jgi:GNAT superfamily N-acetyltransferase
VRVSITIRLAELAERAQLREIELAAGRLFAGVGLEDVSNHEPETLDGLARYIDAGRAWVIADDDVTAGYALVTVVDGLAHLEQISVRPEFGRRGLGAELLEYVCEWARQQQFTAITLTTFVDVAWNAPFYASHGFDRLDDADMGPGLRTIRAEETAHGLDPARRIGMRRSL